MINENLQILATLGSALAVYLFIRMGARKDVRSVELRMDKIETRMEKFENKLEIMNDRLTRFEGRFDERGYWESRSFYKTGTENKK